MNSYIFTFFHFYIFILNALILAAGLGTRLKPLTDTMPKALVPVAGKPLLQHQLERLQAAGFDRFVVNIHHFGQQIIDFLEANHQFGLPIQISDERQLLLDTGGAIRQAAPLFGNDDPILIHNVDILHHIDLRTFYQQSSDGADATLLVSERNTQRYLLFDSSDRLVGWTNIQTSEVKSPFPHVHEHAADYRHLAFSGIHVVTPRLLPLMQSWPDRFSIIDFYLQACANHTIRAVEHHDTHLLDVGKIASLDEAATFFTTT